MAQGRIQAQVPSATPGTHVAGMARAHHPTWGRSSPLPASPLQADGGSDPTSSCTHCPQADAPEFFPPGARKPNTAAPATSVSLALTTTANGSTTVWGAGITGEGLGTWGSGRGDPGVGEG